MAYEDVQIGRLAFVDVTYVNIAIKFLFRSHLATLFGLDTMDMLFQVGNDVTTRDNLTWIRI